MLWRSYWLPALLGWNFTLKNIIKTVGQVVRSLFYLVFQKVSSHCRSMIDLHLHWRKLAFAAFVGRISFSDTDDWHSFKIHLSRHYIRHHWQVFKRPWKGNLLLCGFCPSLLFLLLVVHSPLLGIHCSCFCLSFSSSSSSVPPAPYSPRQIHKSHSYGTWRRANLIIQDKFYFRCAASMKILLHCFCLD